MGDHGAGHLSPLFARRLLRWDGRAGVFRLELDDGFRQILTELMQQFLDLLDDPGAPVLHRLFPPAYSDQSDLMRQEEYRRLMQEDLVERHRDEARLVIATAETETLTEEQLMAWSRAINSIRLILGTYLDVSDDGSADRAPDSVEESAYGWLSFLLEETVQALSERI